MATFSKSFSNNSKYTLILTVIEVTDSKGNVIVDVANNTNDVDWELKMTSGSASFGSWYVDSSVVLDGEEVFIDSVKTSLSANSTLILGSGRQPIKHDGNGKKTLSCKASASTATTHSYLPGSASIDESLPLTTIPRKSDVTCPSFNAGDSTNIVISKKDSSFTSTIRYVFGDLSETIVTKTKETVVGWTPNADDFYAQFPDAKQKSGTIYCDTYSGSTLIGTSETSFTCYAKESECKPDITLKAIDVRELTKALTGDENVIVKGMSDVQLTSTITYKKSATAKSYVVSSGDGKKSTSNPATLESVDSGIFTATVTDSREYSSSAVVDKTKENKFIDYTKLAITNVNVGRPETTSSIVNIELKGNYYNGNFSADVPNTLKLKFRHREQGGEWAGGIVNTEIATLTSGEALYTKVEIKYGQENLPDGVTATYDGEIMTVSHLNPLTGETEKIADITVGESCFAWAEIEYGDTNLPEGYSATYDSENKMIITGPKFIADYVELTPTISGDTFSYSGQLGDTFSYKKQYEFEFYAEDELMYVSASDKPIIVTKGISIIRVGDGYVDIRGDLLQNGQPLSSSNPYPVGSIYLSVNSTNPSTLFGGTWEQLKDRFLLGAGSTYSNGDTGGSATHTHTLGNGYAMACNSSEANIAMKQKSITTAWSTNRTHKTSSMDTGSSSQKKGLYLGGSTDSASSLPPYLVVYMWKRIA